MISFQYNYKTFIITILFFVLIQQYIKI